MSVDELDEFTRGVEAALDPQPIRSTAGSTGEAVTSIHSWFHHRRCTTCGHSFRRGDRVLIDPDTRDVAHLDPQLGCAGGEPADEDGAVDITWFADGLQAAWPPPQDLPLTRLTTTHALLAPARGNFGRASCLFCAHTFRRDELVILCPCRPLEPLCRAAVHRDPAKGLVCWESWRPGNRVNRCPISLRRLDE
jgi:NAD-dependent SIR2 family protein deacetylase